MTQITWHIVSRAALPLFFAVFTLFSASVVAVLCAIGAHAHHPGSHAWRQSGTDQVKLEAVAVVTDGCTGIASVFAGVPSGHSAPPDTFPITVRLQSIPSSQACTMQARVVKNVSYVDVPTSWRRLHVFILKPDGSLQATERVPIN